MPLFHAHDYSGLGIPTNKFTPVLSHLHNNRDHHKITVIDGKVGYTGGINLADEYINKTEKYGHWKDSAVRLEGDAVKSLTSLFLENWNAQADIHLDSKKYTSVIWNPDYRHITAQSESVTDDDAGQPICAGKGASGFVIPFGDGPEPVDNAYVGKTVYLNIINSSRRYLYITTPYLICDHELMNALRVAALRGVDVRIITPHIPDKKAVFLMTRSSYSVLIGDGVKIYEYTPGFIHAKNMICDDRFAVCGTINLDYRSLVHHFECGVWMFLTKSISDMKADFMRTVSVSEQISPGDAALKRRARLAAEVMKIFSPLL